MKVRKYYVHDMREGMLRIREDLGPEAIIIQSRRVRPRGLLGFLQPSRMEITAAVENKPFREKAPQQPLQEVNDHNSKQIALDIEELKKAVNRLVLREGLPADVLEKEQEEIARWKTYLRRQEIFDELVDDFIQFIREKAVDETRLSDELIGLILRKRIRMVLKTAPEKASPIQVFVGPTGVGKTTTLAKLAARYALYQGERVGIITIDHYRIGAVEQLRTYADITGLPLEVVMTPRELGRAVDRLEGCQRILIDTAGRSTMNQNQIQEMANYLQNLPPAEIFLVISATTKAQDISRIVQNFKCMGYNRLIFSKLDETQSYGILLNGIYLTEMPAIYLTTGQSVPDDICLADLDRMSAYILGEED